LILEHRYLAHEETEEGPKHPYAALALGSLGYNLTNNGDLQASILSLHKQPAFGFMFVPPCSATVGHLLFHVMRGGGKAV